MRFLWLAVLLCLTLTLAGCEAIANIFQAGFAVGVIVVVAILAGIAFLVTKARH
jgi:hypothetical protein